MSWTVGDSSFELFVPLYGVTKRVHIDDLGCELRKRNAGFSLHPIGEGVSGGAAGREANKGRGRGARTGAAPGPHGFSGCRMMPGAIPPGGVHVKMLTRMKVKLFALNKIPIDFALEVQSVYDHELSSSTVAEIKTR